MKKVTFSRSIWLLLIMIMAIGTAQSQEVADPSDALNYDANKAAQIDEKTKVFNESRTDNKESIFSESTANNNRTGGCYISPDGSYGTFGRNDDGSLGPFSLPFGFDLYGTVYTQVWINNNGNITFTGPYSSFTASGFPFGLPMVAPFWGDVDTRGSGSGVVRYKINPTNMIVAWDQVGYYGAHYEKRNSFQLVISNANDPLIGIGNNVAFYYGDMQWTTGDASGGYGGFGGSPATVGINKGNNVDYVQIGRFGNPGSAYDGPGGATDGIDYLDNQCFTFNVSNAFNQPPAVSGVPSGNVVNLACGETQTISLSFIGPEVAQTVTTAINTGGLCNTTTNITNGSVSVASVTITASACNQGSHVISFTATDNYSVPASTTVDITVNVATCCVAPTITCPTQVVAINDAGQCGAIVNYSNATTTGSPAPTVSYSQPSGSYFPVGTTEVTVTAENSCGVSTCTFNVTVNDEEAPVALTQNITIQLDAAGQANISAGDINNGSSDNCGVASISVFPAQFDCNQVGEQIVTLTVIDNNNNEATATAVVTVVDNMDPEALCQALTIALDETGSASITASQIDNGSNDNCGVASVTLFPMDFSCADLGENTVTLTVTDNNQNVSVCTSTVTVEDNILPVLTAIANPITLWPPNHKYETISMSQLFVSVWDNCGVLSIDDVYITSVTSDEVENANGNGDGNTVNDIIISSDCSSVDLRKERSGNGNGRVYTIYMSVDDGNGNTGTASCQVQVPHNKGGTAIDDGMAYEVAANCGFKNAAVLGGVDLPQIVGMNLYPNPTNEKATVEFTLTEANNTTVHVYNSMGMRIATLFDGMAVPDHRYELEFDGSSQSVGMYYVILQSGASIHEVKKMILNR